MITRKRGARKCRHRSEKIGHLKAGCSGCAVFECAKHGGYCTLVSPPARPLPLLVDDRATEVIITRENSRACSICCAEKENE